MTVHELRKQGYKVRVYHSRMVEGITGFELVPVNQEIHSEILLTGGKTEVKITSPDGLKSADGIADCSVKDHFNRKIGLNIALGRAWKNLSS